MRQYSKNEIAEIAKQYSIDLDPDWSGVGQLWPLCEMMMTQGSVVILKLDGERVSDGDTGKYTVIAMGGLLGESQIRGDFETLDEATSYLVGNYFAITT